MIIFLDSDAKIRAQNYGNVGRGSSVSWIYIVAPISASNAYISFTLPNGDHTGEVIATQEVGAVDLGLVLPGTGLRCWSYKLEKAITQYSGTVSYTVSFTFPDGSELVSNQGSFNVARGNPSLLPDQPTDNIYEQIKAALETICGTNSEMLDRLERVEEKTVDFDELAADIEERLTDKGFKGEKGDKGDKGERGDIGGLLQVTDNGGVLMGDLTSLKPLYPDNFAVVGKNNAVNNNAIFAAGYGSDDDNRYNALEVRTNGKNETTANDWTLKCGVRNPLNDGIATLPENTDGLLLYNGSILAGKAIFKISPAEWYNHTHYYILFGGKGMKESIGKTNAEVGADPNVSRYWVCYEYEGIRFGRLANGKSEQLLEVPISYSQAATITTTIEWTQEGAIKVLVNGTEVISVADCVPYGGELGIQRTLKHEPAHLPRPVHLYSAIVEPTAGVLASKDFDLYVYKGDSDPDDPYKKVVTENLSAASTDEIYDLVGYSSSGGVKHLHGQLELNEGHLNARKGYRINGRPLIDENRNLVNIGSISGKAGYNFAKIAHGTYTGDGGGSRTLTFGFKPVMVVIQNTAAGYHPYIFSDDGANFFWEQGIVWTGQENAAINEVTHQGMLDFTVSDYGLTFRVNVGELDRPLNVENVTYEYFAIGY